ncbi:MAG: sulfatase-like hydrolase/transferase [Acidobacteria bacterium]|nr:sulfatase-like hydrolase/transferase [Acidobacteriota bacterium]
MRDLRDEGLLENTIIIFTSDNGALWPNVVEHGDPRHDNNGPFRDYKASVYEGGHRVPFIAR